MLSQISLRLREKISRFSFQDNLIFNNTIIPLSASNYSALPNSSGKTVAFVDGGQAEIISTGNFGLSFIRVAGIVLKDNQKVKEYLHEFYLLTTASYRQEDIWYDSEIFASVGEELVSTEDLEISSSDATIKAGKERAPLAKVANLARRFAELSLASLIPADFVILDGTLEPTWKNEEKYLSRLGKNVCALAKSCSLFTVLGNNPAILLGKTGISGCWSYFVDGKTYFVKLHPESKHVFRFEGNQEALNFLLGNSSDPLFLGYPYGLVLADQRARVSNLEKNSLRMRFLLDGQNREIVEYLRASDAHEILDSLG